MVDKVFMLVDNGSLVPASSLALRRLASELSDRVGTRIVPVSAMHSDKIPKQLLNDIEADTFSPLVEHHLTQGVQGFYIIPLFLGPSYTIEGFLPREFKELARGYSGAHLSMASCLAGEDLGHVEDPGYRDVYPDRRLAQILCEHVRAVIRQKRLIQPRVVVVDHGSPQEKVIAVRNQLGNQLQVMLGNEIAELVVSSMERRSGPKYAFNEPLLEDVLRGIGGGQPIIVAQMFLLAGRHAGPGGDIEQICETAKCCRPDLRIFYTPLIAEHPLLLHVLADRFKCTWRKGSKKW